MKKSVYILLLLFATLSWAQYLYPQIATSWQTLGDGSKLFEKQTDLEFVNGQGSNSKKINIDQQTKYQTIEGFGWTLTQGSAKLIKALNSKQQSDLLDEVFNTETGLGSSVIRIGIGATDLSERAYTYHEVANDWNLTHFSLSGPDNDDLIPVLKAIVAINPNVKILATPWTPPTWMKQNTDGFNNYIGGKLNKACYEVYAKYFIKYFEAMRAEGLEIWAVTPQNEPLHDGNEPSMRMTKEEQYDFVHNYLGPAIRNSSFSHVKIIAYDHNCDRPDYAIDVCKSEYVDGSAFHLYDAEANIGALTQVRTETGKDVYFTEQYTGPDNFPGDLAWHMEKVMLGAVNNWARIVMEWNLAANQNYEPHTAGGCTSCLGALTINNQNIERNISYYLIAQMSKVAKAGAYRIGTSANDDDLIHAAFENVDGSVSVVVHNKGNRKKSFDIVYNNKSLSYTVNANTAVSIMWIDTEDIKPVETVVVIPESGQITIGQAFQLIASVLPADATFKTVRWTSNNENIAYVSDGGLVRGVAKGNTTITATSLYGDRMASSAITVVDNGTSSDFQGIYNIVSLYSNKALDVKDHSTSHGAGIQQWELGDNGQNNQQWIFENAPDGHYFIKSKHSGLYLGAANTSFDNGINLVQQNFSATESQQWNVSRLATGNYSIINIYNEKSVDVSGPSMENGAKIHLWDYFDSAENQKWKFIKVDDTSDIIETNSTSDFRAYPNPLHDYMNIEWTTREKRNIQIFNISGKQVFSKITDDLLFTVDTSSFEVGVYIVNIKDKSGTYYQKIIKVQQ